MTEHVNLWRCAELRAKIENNLPAEWESYSASCVEEDVGPDTIRIAGAVAPIMKRKKHRDWDKLDKATVRTYWYNIPELRQWAENYERENGLCVACMGEKQLLHSWSRDTGAKYRVCNRCTQPVSEAAK